MPTDPNGVAVVPQPADAPAREVVEPNDVEPLHPRPDEEGTVAKIVPTAVQLSPTPKPLAVGYSIQGQVMSKDGPVRDDEPGQWLSVTISAPDIARRCEIDEQGCFECTRLDAGSYLVSVDDRVRPHRFVCRPIKVRLDAQTSSAVLDLKPGETCDAGTIVLKPPEVLTGILRGRIMDEQGEPVVNRDVRISAKGASSLGTDDEGYFTVQRLPTDELVTVTVMVPGYGK
jgi:hypothetical protein